MLPFRPELATMDDVVHGGAIASLIDTAGMAVVLGRRRASRSRWPGSTVTLNVNYVAAARGQDLTATAVVVKRGRSMVFSEVRVTEPDGRARRHRLGRAAARACMAEAEARELSRPRDELSALPRGIGDIHARDRRARVRRARPAGRAGAADPRRDLARRLRERPRRPAARDARVGTAAGAEPATSRCPRRRAARWRSRRSTGSTATGSRPRAARWRSRWQCAAHGAPATPHARGLPPRARRDRVRVGRRRATATGCSEDLGITPVFVRFNTGRHISAERRVARALLDELSRLAGRGGADHAGRALDGRPRRAQRLPPRRRLDGARAPRPSRSARRTRARRSSRPCTRMSAALHVAPETRPFARFLRRRSAGIRDLRRGSLVDEDWRDQDPDALRAKALRRGPAARGRHPLLRRRHDHAQRQAPARPPARRHARALPQRLRPRAVGFARTRPRARRHAPPRAAQPPRGLRAAARLARGVIARLSTSCPYSHSLWPSGSCVAERARRAPRCSGPSGMWWCSRRSPLIRCTRVARSTRSAS